VDSFGGIDILVTRISILFIIVIIITITPWSIVNGLCSIIISELLGVYVLEEAIVFHGMI
jgi:hypothetical protein